MGHLGKSYFELTDAERDERKDWAAKEMRKLSESERSALISAADNVIDARERFRFRMRQVCLARSYRKPMKPKGVA